MSILIQFGNLRKKFGILREFWYLVDLTKILDENYFSIGYPIDYLLSCASPILFRPLNNIYTTSISMQHIMITLPREFLSPKCGK